MLARFAARARGDVREVEIEDHLRPIDTARNNEVRVHRAAVAVDHEVRIKPVIVRCSPAAARPTASAPSSPGLHCRQNRSPISIVYSRNRGCCRGRVHVRDVIAAIQVVIDEHLPVALHVYCAARPSGTSESACPQMAGRELRSQVRAEARAIPPSQTNAHCSTTSQSIGTRPCARSKSHTPAKSGVPFSAPSSRRSTRDKGTELLRGALRRRSQPPRRDDGTRCRTRATHGRRPRQRRSVRREAPR